MGSGPVTIALLGAGARGELALGMFVERYPKLLRYAAVAEPNELRRTRFVRRFAIPKENVFEDWRELLDRPRMADALINTTPDSLHYESTLLALRNGYHVLLEKPMARTPAECAHLVQVAEREKRILQIFLQLRYAPIYQKVHGLLSSGFIGRLMNINNIENVGYWHFTMNFVRGSWSRSANASSVLLAKSVHDADLMTWFAGARAARVASVGELSFFTERNAPEGAPERCIDGCPVEESCPFNAVKLYLRPGRPQVPLSLFLGVSFDTWADFSLNPRFRTLASAAMDDIDPEACMRALREGPHGRCVFRCDNDVVDHQSVSIEYENGVTASFTLSAFSLVWERSLDLGGSGGEIRTDDLSGRLETRRFSGPAMVRKKRVRYRALHHGGGDESLLLEFARALQKKDHDSVLTSGKNTLEAHLICFAGEEARLGGRVVDMKALRERAEVEANALEEPRSEGSPSAVGAF